MSLRHALLAVLTAEPMTGYELLKYFDGTVAAFWSAPHSQVYPELRRMEAAGLISAEVAARGERAQKRIYSVTGPGISELSDWIGEHSTVPPERDVARLRAAHFEFSSYDVARRQLTAHLTEHQERLTRLESMVQAIQDLRVPLLRRRFEKRPEAEHEAIAAFKEFAFRGQIARVKAEIAWAKQGLDLIADLERRSVPLRGPALD
jgi:PadR family transcriptional regulator AphA